MNRLLRTALLAGLAVSCGILVGSTSARETAPTVDATSFDAQLEADWIRQIPYLTDVDPMSLIGMTPAIDAAGAVDGVKNGRWGFHTLQDDKPWWQVDLGSEHPLRRVDIYNRCDSGVANAKQILVLISTDGKQWEQVYEHDGTVFHGKPDGKPLRVSLHGAKARFVRLQLPTKAFMYLDEVEVYPEAPGWTNIARGRPASQSSISKWSAPADGTLRMDGLPLIERVGRDAVEAALELAEKTLGFLEDDSPQPGFTAQLAELQSRVAETASDEPDNRQLYLDIRRVRREMILTHPLLDFDRLLINKRPPPGFCHQSDQYLARHSGIGEGLTILDNWREEPRETVILEGQLPPGSMLHPDLSFDGKRILFSYTDHTEPEPELRRFFLYEVNVDGTGLRQITGTAADSLEGAFGRESVLIEDWDPCYLPDGGIAFVSSRNQGGVRCHHGGRYCPTYTLYRSEADGSHIRPMVYGEANEWEPSLLRDGRIIWTRWDYINRHDTIYQSLWTIRPDGTGTAHYYGNYTRNPCSIGEAKSIPGSHRVVATAAAHHSYTSGSLIMIDPYVGRDGEEPLTRITPESPFPETESYPVGSYATPHPLSEQLYLAAFTPEQLAKQNGGQSDNAYGIYLVDTLGGRELLYRDPQMSAFAPIPLVPRETPPPQLPSMLAGIEPTPYGEFFVQNVYRSAQPIPEGTVKNLRVIEVYPQTTQRVPDRSLVLFETAKRIVGQTPVNEDGSVAFRAPAGVPLLLQLVDENDMTVMSMRSILYAHPGESLSCVGCHEPRNTSPTPIIAQDVVYRDLEPPVGPKYEGGLSFARTVQPVLDRYCIDCHGLDSVEGDVNLLGSMKTDPIKLGVIQGSTAYDSLMGNEGLVSVALRNMETPYSQPKDYFSHAGRLAKMLLDGDENHQKLPQEDFQRIVYWLDLNAPFFGDYSWNKQEWRSAEPDGEKALRAYIRDAFGEGLAAQPFASLVNTSLPTESRILMAPLAKQAGGWGQVESGAWTSTGDVGYLRMLTLVDAAIAPLATEDIAGTCNQDPCVCGGCWVRKARTEYRNKVTQVAP